MREPIACGLLIACAAVFPSQNAACEEPSHRIMPTRGSPNTVGRATGARYNPPNPPKCRTHVPTLKAPTRSPANVRPERPSNTRPTMKDGTSAPVDPPVPVGHGVESVGEVAITVTAEPDKSDATPVEADRSAFLLPTWSPGFWAMPPGGLTRYLFPSRQFVNPDQAFMSATNDIDAISRATD